MLTAIAALEKQLASNGRGVSGCQAQGQSQATFGGSATAGLGISGMGINSASTVAPAASTSPSLGAAGTTTSSRNMGYEAPDLGNRSYVGGASYSSRSSSSGSSSSSNAGSNRLQSAATNAGQYLRGPGSADTINAGASPELFQNITGAYQRSRARLNVEE